MEEGGGLQSDSCRYFFDLTSHDGVESKGPYDGSVSLFLAQLGLDPRLCTPVFTRAEKHGALPL